MRTHPLTALCLCLVLLLAAAPLAAEPLTSQQLREEMTPVYQALQTDVEYLALSKELANARAEAEVIERYLKYLPMSPMLMLEIDMYLKHYEIGIPRFIAEWHEQWIKLHEKEAVEMYGKDYVEGRLRGVVDGEAAPGWTLKSTVGTNRNVAATFTPDPEDYQGEVQVAVNPNNPDQIVAGANTWDDMGGACEDGIQAAFYSGDGGDTWGYTCPPNHLAYGMSCPYPYVFGSDPAIYWNDANEVFFEYMLICTPDGQNNRYAIVVARSSDGGVNWSAQGIVINSWGTGNLEDKNFYAIDNNPASPYHGRHYTCWDRNNNERSAYSTDNGATWHEVDLPPTGGGGSRYDLGCELAVEDNGTVHVIYDTLTCPGYYCNNEEMFYSRSTNGGVSWSTPLEIHDFNLVGFSGANCPAAQADRCIGPMGAIDVDNSGGACDGYLYAAYGEYTTGGVNATDIYVIRSTDGGTSWDTPVQVNDDGLTSRVQFHPFLMIDQSNGYVVVAWHDARNDPGNHEIDYFIARSADCGVTWETNIQVSQASPEFNNTTISYSNMNVGDNPQRNINQYLEYLGLDVLDGTAYVAWTDTRHYFPGFPGESQRENIGFVKVDILPDVWSKDRPWDTGLEPDPATQGQSMWLSQDIWVRNDATPGPHQNPEAGQQNYVWVNVRNRSDIPAYNMPIEVWGTLASTGLSWPDDWGHIGTAIVPVVPAQGLVEATVPWTPTVTGHYCLLVRHDTAQDPLTYPETSAVGYNTRYNNNIVWKNVNIVDLVTDPVVEVKLLVRNISGLDLEHNVVFQEAGAKAEDGVFLDRGKVVAHLPETLATRWDAEGSKGDGVDKLDANTVEITDANRAALTVNLKKGEKHTLVLTFEDTAERPNDTLSAEETKTKRYTFTVIQEEVRGDKTETIGGVTYEIIVPQN